MSILSTRALLLAKVETTSGTDALPTVLLNAIQIINPQITTTTNFLERKFTKPDFSDYNALPGRKIVNLKFDIELAPSSINLNGPNWSTLLLGASMAPTYVTAASTTIAAGPTGAVRNAPGRGATFTTTTPHGLVLGQSVVVAGVTDTSFNTPAGTTVTVVAASATTFQVVNIGTPSATSGGGTVSRAYAKQFSPITDSQQTLTIYLYLDGWLHKLTGCMGNFSIMAKGGEFGMVTFDFQGNYTLPGLLAMPTGVTYDTISPAIVETAQLNFFGSSTLIADTFKMDMKNTVVQRPDMNQVSGLRGFRISNRSPDGGIDPEVDLTQTFWTTMTSLDPAVQLGAMNVVFGGGVSVAPTYQPGAIVFSSSTVQIMNMPYGDRDGLRTYDLALRFRRSVGNDEISLSFY